MSEYQPTPKQEQALREYLHEAVVPLIEDVLVKKLGQAMAYLKEQQQPEQEPVGTYEGVMETMLSLRKGTLEQQQIYTHMKDKLLYTAPPKQPEQEPVTAHQALEALDELESCARGDEPFNHFAAPLVRQFIEQAVVLPKKEWVGLTDEELRETYCKVSGKEWCLGGLANAHTFYEAIEAKLKEKNSCG